MNQIQDNPSEITNSGRRTQRSSDAGAGSPRLRKGILALLGAISLSLYPICYFALRQAHEIVHYENVLIEGGHSVESRDAALNVVFFPLRMAEVIFHRLK